VAALSEIMSISMASAKWHQKMKIESENGVSGNRRNENGVINEINQLINICEE
jgi:hypothetical protein